MMKSVSIVIPTYNSAKTLKYCLQSIAEQEYPVEKIEIIIVDGGSTDGTIEIARDYTDKIFDNSYRVEEKGKVIGVSVAQNEIIAFIDADNILDTSEFLQRLMEPFLDEEITAAEPLYYAHRQQDSLLTRYCGLIGGDDPIAVYLGYFNRFCYFKGKWTEAPVAEDDKGDYLKVELTETSLPPMGANGFFVRREVISALDRSHFLHTDVVYHLVKAGHKHFAMVKVGITHRHADSISVFLQKKARRVRRLLAHDNPRDYQLSIDAKRAFRLVMTVAVTFPLFIDTVKGFRVAPDRAWLLHPIMCWLVLVVYGTIFAKSKLLEGV